MTRGFQSDPLFEHAALMELAALTNVADAAYDVVTSRIRIALDDGCRADVIAAQLGVSRSSLYRRLRR